MNYRVVWEENATQEVASEFIDAKDKVAIIDATHQINRALESAPASNGIPISEGLYYIDRIPLRAIYSIDVETENALMLDASGEFHDPSRRTGRITRRRRLTDQPEHSSPPPSVCIRWLSEIDGGAPSVLGRHAGHPRQSF